MSGKRQEVWGHESSLAPQHHFKENQDVDTKTTEGFPVSHDPLSHVKVLNQDSTLFAPSAQWDFSLQLLILPWPILPFTDVNQFCC